MNLRESIDSKDDGMPNPIEGREVMLYASGLIQGFREARDLRLAISTDGPTMRIHDLRAGTRSAAISRRNIKTTADCIVALRAQLDAHPFWVPESDDWGPDPWGDD